MIRAIPNQQAVLLTVIRLTGANGFAVVHPKLTEIKNAIPNARRARSPDISARNGGQSRNEFGNFLPVGECNATAENRRFARRSFENRGTAFRSGIFGTEEQRFTERIISAAEKNVNGS